MCAVNAALWVAGCAGSPAASGAAAAGGDPTDAAAGDVAAGGAAGEAAGTGDTGTATAEVQADAAIAPDLPQNGADISDDANPVTDTPPVNGEDGQAPDAAVSDSASEDGSDTASPQPDTAPPDPDTAPPIDVPPIDVPPVCLPTAPSKEVCDGVDNDCDGTTDKPSDGEGPPCNDGNSCTIDICSGKLGCKSTPCFGDSCGTGCDDGNPCTLSDQCAAGTCKAGTAKCQDADACTTDSCDAKTGACAYAPIVGCKACKLVTDCQDANDCTTDGCTAGVCTWKPIVGCVGPTDYQIKAFSLDKPEVGPSEALKLTLTVTNFGKPYLGAYPGMLKWALYMSADQVVDASDFKLYGETWTEGNVGPPNQTEATRVMPFYAPGNGNWDQIYWCVLLMDGGDSNVTNNTACIPNPLKLSELTVTSLKANATPVVANAQSLVTVGISNSGGAGANVGVKLFASIDDTWSAADLQLDYVLIPTIAKASAKDYVVKYTPSPKVQATYKYLCVQVKPVDKLVETDYLKEKVPLDNMLCVAQTFENPAEISVEPSQVAFSVGNLTTNSPAWGGTLGCYANLITNVGYGTAAPPMKMRCWLGGLGAWDTAPWKVAWSNLEGVGGAVPGCQNCFGTLKTTFSDVTAKLVDQLPLGPATLCMELNDDKAIVESNYANNVACNVVQLVGVDLLLSIPQCDILGGLKTLTVGVEFTTTFVFGNGGNAVLSNPKIVAGRTLLSKDDKPSDDDIVIWSGYANVGPLAGSLTKPAYAQMHSGVKFTLDAAKVPPGAYNMIWEVNHTGAVVEPKGNNVLVRAVTVK